MTPLPDNGDLRADALELLRRANSYWASPQGAVVQDLMSGIGLSDLRPRVREEVADAGSAWWLAVLERAVARGEARREALRPRVATLPIVLLRNEFLTSGTPDVDDRVLVEIVDHVYLPLVRNR
ncbi:TetR-like C-terminal domain-containing protein [Actinosynnema sp. CA-248983]